MPWPPTRRTVTLKLYGGVDVRDAGKESYVITEDDHLDYAMHAVQRRFLPAAVEKVLLESAFLFLGHGLREWPKRLVAQALLQRRRPTKYRSWAVTHAASEVDSLLWERRNVELIDTPLGHYVDGLERRRDGWRPRNDRRPARRLPLRRAAPTARRVSAGSRQPPSDERRERSAQR